MGLTLGNKIGIPRASGLKSWSSYWAKLKIFNAGSFDFIANRLNDISGNNNHFTLKNASARTSISGNLDYVITGILTSDVISVVDGSNTPTIPSNGILRIAEGQVVYGVTITRGGVVWAVIPFCEPYINENIPTVSYDVSGNGHHATCAGLTANNITTQDDYFYLMEHGYSLGSSDILNWNTGSWTGSIDSYNAIFSGVTLGTTQSENTNIQPTPDGLGCRMTDLATYNMKFRRFSAMVVGQRYRLKIHIENYYSNGVSGGYQVSNLGLTAANRNWVLGVGDFDLNGVATNTTFEMGASSTAFNRTIDFYNPTLQLLVVVPGLLAGSLDAVGNPIEFIQDGYTLLNYAGDIQAPTSLLLADQKGYWSDYINQGYCVSGKTYLIEATELDHFGVGKEVFDEFISNGTEFCDDNNVVRELILHGTERGFFFDDDGTPHPRGYSDFVSIKPHFMYCSMPKTEEYHAYDPAETTTLPKQLYNNIGYGWKGQRNDNKINDLTVLRPESYLTDAQKIIANQLYIKAEAPTFAMVSFIYDSWTQADYLACCEVFESRKLRLTRAIYFSDDVTKEQTDALKLLGHEIAVHTPSFGAVLPSHKDFADTAANYTEEELNQYYADVAAWANNNGYELHKILPGGSSDALNQLVVNNYFKTAFLAAGSENVNRIPIVKYNNIGRFSCEFLDAGELATAEGLIDVAIANKGWIIVYSHTYSHNANTLTNQGQFLDYIKSKMDAGDKIRVVKIEDAYNIIKGIK